MLRLNILAVSAIAAFALLAPSAAEAREYVLDSERAVKELPLEQRPNRIGHFYGNTIRRRHYGTMFVNRQLGAERPVARFFYIAN